MHIDLNVARGCNTKTLYDPKKCMLWQSALSGVATNHMRFRFLPFAGGTFIAMAPTNIYSFKRNTHTRIHNHAIIHSLIHLFDWSVCVHASCRSTEQSGWLTTT